MRHLAPTQFADKLPLSRRGTREYQEPSRVPQETAPDTPLYHRDTPSSVYNRRSSVRTRSAIQPSHCHPVTPASVTMELPEVRVVAVLVLRRNHDREELPKSTWE